MRSSHQKSCRTKCVHCGAHITVYNAEVKGRSATPSACAPPEFWRRFAAPMPRQDAPATRHAYRLATRRMGLFDL